ncbi:MAG: XRE family transcriptional regulator [Spirochaetes bacterium]|nr:XRE family transcriptional regulator [Spirochaetota bacterium]
MINLGAILRYIRLDKSLTLKDVSRKLKITESLLSQIENEKISPSLHTLEELLKYYAVTFSDFFKQVEQKKYIMVKKDNREEYNNTEGGYKLTLLASKLQNNTLESYLVDLIPGFQIESATLKHETIGERFLYLNTGSLSIIIDNDNFFNLNEGDSINYKSYVPCVIKNTGDNQANFLISGEPPVFIY